MGNDLLLYSNGYWEEKLGPEFRKNNLENKLHLIFSLLVFLEISLAQFLTFTFSSKIEKVKARAGRFMGYTESANNEANRFPPGAIWHMWIENFPKWKPHLFKMIWPAARKIALGESNKIIEDRVLQVTVSCQVIGKKIKNVEERVFGIFEDARDVQEVGSIRTNIKAPKRTVAISKCGPDEVESFCCAGISG